MTASNPKPRRVLRKINAMTQAQLIKLLLIGDMTCTELAEETGLHYVTVLQYCRELHKAGAAYVARWDADIRGRHLIRIYKLGDRRDAARPKMTASERTAAYRRRMRAAAMNHLMAGPTHADRHA